MVGCYKLVFNILERLFNLTVLELLHHAECKIPCGAVVHNYGFEQVREQANTEHTVVMAKSLGSDIDFVFSNFGAYMFF